VWHIKLDLRCVSGSVLGPLLFTIYTADIPETATTKIATYADDVTVVAASENPLTTSQNLHHLNLISDWYTTWRTTVNQKKSVQITFTTSNELCKYLQPQKQSILASTSIKGLLGENTSKPKENNLT
jgi:hypothetical protein